MAHPFAKHAEERAGKDRAKSFTKGYKRGGKVHSDEAADKKLFGKMIKQHEKEEMKVEGKASGGRLDKFARGGRAKHKGNNTKINIVVAPKGPHPADGAAPPIPLGPPPMGGGPLAGPPPGMPPMGGPKPPGMMARGGRLHMTAGAETGKGRLQKAKAYKARG